MIFVLFIHGFQKVDGATRKAIVKAMVEAGLELPQMGLKVMKQNEISLISGGVFVL